MANINRLRGEMFALVYAKKAGTYVGTFDYGKRKKGERFIVLKADINGLSVSLGVPKEEVKVEAEPIETPEPIVEDGGEV